MPTLGVYYGKSHITGEKGSISGLIQKLVIFRRSEVLRWLATISAWVSDDSKMFLPQNQMEMAKTLLENSLFQKLETFAHSEKNSIFLFFHPRQTLFILQIALLACSEDSADFDEETLRNNIGEACLIANDILQDLDTNAELKEGNEEANKWMVSLLPYFGRKEEKEILARAQSFWFDIPKKDFVRERIQKKGFQDLESAFEKKYGLSLGDYFLILYNLYLGFKAHSIKESSPLLLDIATYLEPYYDSRKIKLVLSTICQSADKLSLRLLDTPRQNWGLDFTPLRMFPVLEVFEGKLACHDLNLFHKTLTDKIYFLLQDAFEQNEFTELFGYIFEEYINQFFRRFTYSGEILVRDFYESPKFEIKKTDQAADSIFVRDSIALIMEYKARLLTTQQKFGGIIERTWQGIDEIIAGHRSSPKKGIVQLGKSISRILSGEGVSSESGKPIDFSNCKTFHPVIVTYESLVGIESIRQYAEDKFRMKIESSSGIDKDRIGPLLILTVEEIELLENLSKSNTAIMEILKEYINFINDHPKARVNSFYTFVISKTYYRKPGSKSLVEEIYQRAWNSIGDKLKKRCGNG